MKIRFKLLQESDCDLVIKARDVYYSSNSNYTSVQQIKKEHATLINLVTYHSLKEDSLVYQEITDGNNTEFKIPTASDGHYTFTRILLPNSQWVADSYIKYLLGQGEDPSKTQNTSEQVDNEEINLDTTTDEEESNLEDTTSDEDVESPDEFDDVVYNIPQYEAEPTIIIWHDGINIRKGIGNTETDEIIKDPTQILGLNFDTTVYECSTDTFLICGIYNCYINICNKLLDACIDRCFKDPNPQDSYIRDILYMGIVTIKYLVDQEHLDRAQQILERLNRCPGLCGNINPDKTKYSCGCHR